jgi:hypothetical protein
MGMTESTFEASVGMSRKWDAREAGREVAETTIKNLSRPPDFFLLFSTIHYEKYGGFQEFLNGVWDVLPNGTPLVGGTVVGFMNNYGCYTRGASALAISYSNMDVSIGIGQKTKKNPDKAAENCSRSIIKKLKDSSYKENFVFQLVSGPTMPHFPGFGSGFILKGKIRSSLASKLIEVSTKRLQKGIGREEEVLERMSKAFENSYILSGSCSDDMVLSNNYQFFNEEVHNNSVVALGLKSDRKMNLKYGHGFHKLFDQTLDVTEKSFGGKIIKKINDVDAVNEFIKMIHWSEDMLDERLHEKTFFFPLGFEYPDKTLSPAAIGAILGGGFSFSFKTNSDKLYVLTASGKSIVNAIDACIERDSLLTFGVSCCANLVTLGDDIYRVQEQIQKYLRNFLIIFTLGEGVYLPSEGISKFFNETNIVLSVK